MLFVRSIRRTWKQVLLPAALVSAEAVVAATVYTNTDSEFIVRRNSGTATVEGNIHVKDATGLNATDRFGLLRFDSTGFGVNVDSASFSITADPDTGTFWQGTYTYNVYGVIDGDGEDEDISEATYDPNGVGRLFENTASFIDLSQVTSLGTLDNVSAGDTATLSNPALLTFLQGDTNDIVTLVLVRTSSGGSGNSVFLPSTTGNIAERPQLTFTVIPEPSTALLGGFGVVLLLRRRRK